MKFRALPGLPAHGDLPIQFSASGLGTHSEGFVVEFIPSGQPSWVGNFQRGLSKFDRVLPHPDGKLVVVIAGGECYIVNPYQQSAVDCFGGDFISAWEIPAKDLLILGGPVDFEALNSSGRAWRSKRVSWDGFRGVRLNGDMLTGEAWSYEDVWIPFSLDITTGRHDGGPECPP